MYSRLTNTAIKKGVVMNEEKIERKKKMKEKMIISKTGRAHGFGGDFYKWSSGFSRDERIAIKSGGLVAFDSGGDAFLQDSFDVKTTWRIATYKHNRYSRRVLTQAEFCTLQKILKTAVC